MSAFNDRIPVTILTGFLGAGKSTLLNRILKDPDMKDAAVIINEFGDVGIDHLLVESSGDSIIELSDGCLCCTVRGELVDTLANLMDAVQTGRVKPVKRVVIETTGLADPAPVMQAIMGNPVIATNFELDGVVTVVDAVNGLQTLDNHEEARKQAAVADRLIVSKTSMAGATAGLEQRLRALNPRAAMMDADGMDAGSAAVLVNGLYDPATKIADVGRWLQDEDAHEAHHHNHGHDHDHDGDHHHHGHRHDHSHAGQDPHGVNRHDASIRSFSIVEEKPIDPMALEMFIDLLRSAHGEKLLRMKAIVSVSDRPERPLVLHGVQSIFHPPVRLPAWPDPQDRRTRMVLITKDLPEAFVKDLFDAFLGKPRIDTPDRQALSDNPLAIPGLRI
ncbi:MULTISPECIES: CobW family GTP-binding protein [Rhizobium]|uniref:CobW family GTP-binding protein n=1 Tax=Rhizobium TaxID=379 RepID=UPI0007EC24D4|nr:MULTISPECIES: GTP-binding protein [Rhizobium]ANK93419.1 cobalamin biosynthesis CobW-like protein [Rhizobium sp. N6212]ANK99465.1 cobalamin biosynthesis CobW-like protein [Rhizobium sp. N621]ANL05596.1 cobalamin biosynthesis CobW-like protein [Rhizobium esperanzae]ANL11649.1 cobalamin biosynthesis CobW-like protein [Rhizobium sp. N1341]ANL23723.1 cobalamin biosynthesis CobW-like protein [Rhizobium sp. N113]